MGHHLANPSHIDVDHHVPLKNAHLSGGWAWSPAEKERYANYLGEENHLVVISSRHNRSKGGREPEEWAPPDNALWCDYATDWTEIKQRWNLTRSAIERWFSSSKRSRLLDKHQLLKMGKIKLHANLSTLA